MGGEATETLPARQLLLSKTVLYPILLVPETLIARCFRSVRPTDACCATLCGICRAASWSRMLLSRPHRLWTFGVAVGVSCWGWVSGCRTSLSDRPDDFVSDGSVDIAVLCSGERVGAAQKHAAWLKAVVRAAPGVQVDWAGVSVTTVGVSVIRRAAGRVVESPGTPTQRTITYWAVATQPPGSTGVMMGPIVVRYRTESGEVRTFQSGECPLVVE